MFSLMSLQHQCLMNILMAMPVNQTPICAMMNILSAPSHILFHHHYVTELTTAPHHSQMLNNHNLAFSPLQLTHNQTLQSSDLTIFFQPWQVFISTAEQNRLLLFESPAWIRLKDSIQTHLGLNVLFVCFPQIVQSPQIFINICVIWIDFHQYLCNLNRFPLLFVHFEQISINICEISKDFHQYLCNLNRIPPISICAIWTDFHPSAFVQENWGSGGSIWRVGVAIIEAR